MQKFLKINLDFISIIILTSDQSHQVENKDPIQNSLDLWVQQFYPLKERSSLQCSYDKCK